MAAAALIAMIAGVGVSYGWQPMPDDSQSYEYIVQLEPELAATLADGRTIPLISEVPQEIGPVRRVRIVVGRDKLPRQRLITQLKPVSEGGDGVELAQYQQYGQPAIQQPMNNAFAGTPAAGDRYAQPAAQQTPASSGWNGSEASQPPASAQGWNMPQQQPAAQTAQAWNQNGPASVADNSTQQGPLGRIGDRIDQAAEPLRRGVDQLDDRMRSAAGNLTEKTRNIVDELAAPLAGRSPLQQTPAPSMQNGGSAPPASSPPASTWNGNNPAPPSQPPNHSGHDAAVQWNYADSPGARQPQNSGDFSAPALAGDTWNGGSAQQPAASQQPAVQWPPLNAPPPAGSRDQTLAGNRTQWPGAGSTSQGPQDARTNLADQRASSPQLPTGPETPLSQSNGPRWPGQQPAENDGPTLASPAVRRGLLAEPANRPLDGATGGTPSNQLAENNQSAATSQRTPATTPEPAASPSGWPWDMTAAQPSPRQQTPAAVSNPSDTSSGQEQKPSGGNAAAILAAWVLLSGSAAGNLYLFWSYLDLRDKYRAHVRKSARAAGSRFAAA